MKYLGLDLGSRTLGVAISDITHTIATSYIVIRHNEEYDRLLDDVEKIVKDEHIEKIVLGFPKNMNNTIGPKGELSLEFKKKLEQKLNIEVILQDERLTTKEAESVLIKNNTRRNKRRKVIDKLAATIILQSYLDKEKNL
ncbi:MAG: Holliday junction resolvase RuvX [bacterium]|nr:Holliday junction resolvase RuvX [bacterium]